MNEEILNRKNIFLIPVGDYFGKGKSVHNIVYAPFTGKMLLADTEGLEQLDAVMDELTVEGDINRFLSKIQRAEDIQKMSILPNHTCNFNCSYCYSAKGRSHTILEESKLKAGLDYFINPTRLKERSLSISFIGGGEPLLSWGLVKYGMEYATKLAEKHGFSLLMTLITNGSIMNEEIIRHLKHYHVLPDISFDILEEAQNKNRKHFDWVCHTLDMLCEHELVPSVNATITPDNVSKMTDMLAFMDSRFPKITNMVFEPVVSDSIFTTPAQLRDFYSTYLANFFRVRKLASDTGKSITCRIYKNIDSLLERGCPSKFTLTPQGDVSVCYCTSSPNEKRYAERTYGYVNEAEVHIDADKFRKIHGINVYSLEKCTNCYAKWHCGGGCMCPNDLYDEASLEEVCHFTREMIKHTLLERLEESCRQEEGCSLHNYCLTLKSQEL